MRNQSVMRRNADVIAGQAQSDARQLQLYGIVAVATTHRRFSAGSLSAGLLLAGLFALCVVSGGPVNLHAQDGAAPAQQAASGDAASDMDKRLRRIEDEIIDMRAMIGALQSFAPGSDSATPGTFAPDRARDAFAPREADASSADGDAQVRLLEIQIQALSAQLAEVVNRLGRLEAGDALPRDGDADAVSPQAFSSDDAMPPGGDPGFGTTTVEAPDRTDAGAAEPSWLDRSASAEAAGATDAEAQGAFAQAYDALATQDYDAARRGFADFIETYPDDPLVNNARYWLAEAAFAQGDFVTAANAFVKVYNTAPSGEKSEDTLLKLAIALRRLDRPESACDALSRLEGRLDRMPANFRDRVEDERSRSGCS